MTNYYTRYIEKPELNLALSIASEIIHTKFHISRRYDYKDVYKYNARYKWELALLAYVNGELVPYNPLFHDSKNLDDKRTYEETIPKCNAAIIEICSHISSEIDKKPLGLTI